MALCFVHCVEPPFVVEALQLCKGLGGRTLKDDKEHQLLVVRTIRIGNHLKSERHWREVTRCYVVGRVQKRNQEGMPTKEPLHLDALPERVQSLGAASRSFVAATASSTIINSSRKNVSP